jgi:hypothetical protein
MLMSFHVNLSYMFQLYVPIGFILSLYIFSSYFIKYLYMSYTATTLSMQHPNKLHSIFIKVYLLQLIPTLQTSFYDT